MVHISPRNDEENQRIREERLEKILTAATRVFARRGLAATKIADIAAAAGMSHGLVYHYFKSKEEVFATIAARAMDGAEKVTLMALDRAGTPWERIEWLATLMQMGLQHQPEYWEIAVQAITSDAVPPEVKRMAVEKSEASRKALAQLISQGQAAGECTPGDPEQLALTFLACVQGMALQISAFLAISHDGPMPDIRFALRILKAWEDTQHA